MKVKRLLAALMAFAMLFSLCSCGGKGSEDGAEAEKNNSGNAVAGYVGIEANNDEGKNYCRGRQNTLRLKRLIRKG